MELTAVVDRIEGDLAVLLVGEAETELVVPFDHLPRGTKSGTWLRISFEIDAVGESGARERIDEKLNNLRKRGSRLPGS